MLRLYDAGSGQVQDVRPSRAGELRTWVAGRATATPDGLRPEVVADLVRRAAERHRLRVTVWHQAPDPAEGDAPEQALRAAWNDLNIHPAEFAGHPPEPVDVAIIQVGDRDGPAAAHRVQPGEVTPGPGTAAPETAGPGTAGPGTAGPATAGPGAAGREAAGSATAGPGTAGSADPSTVGLDPLALRLAFLMVHYREPAEVTRDTLELADRTLTELRRQVAGWALSPSKPMCAQYVGDILSAFDDDLDTPSALLTLAALADDPEIPAGAKFEAFAYLDQLFGLDLAREVGR